MTLAVDTLQLGAAGTNCHVVRTGADAREAVVIDPGGEASEIVALLSRTSAACAGILLTHCHWDHLGGVADLARSTGAPVYIARFEAQVLERPDDFYPAGYVAPYSADVLLDGEERIELAGISFETLLVPGHSPAHLAYYAEGALFSGDVVFAGGVGRTDIPFGDWDQLVDSIRLLMDRFPPETVVYSGHGPPTTLGAELARNPFLAELRA